MAKRMQKGSVLNWQEEDSDHISAILGMFVIIEITEIYDSH